MDLVLTTVITEARGAAQYRTDITHESKPGERESQSWTMYAELTYPELGSGLLLLGPEVELEAAHTGRGDHNAPESGAFVTGDQVETQAIQGLEGLLSSIQKILIMSVDKSSE